MVYDDYDISGDSMKVVVANPPWPGEGYGARTNVRWPHRRGDKVLAFPIYLAYTTSVLKKNGFEALGYDAVQRDVGISDFVMKMKELRPRVIVIEVSTPSIMYDLETAHRIKEELPDTFIVLCGAHATHFHKSIIDNYGFIDACIRGEFEYTTRDICIAIRDNTLLSKVEGLTYRNNKGSVSVNKERERLQELDELPLPEREDFKIEDYQQAFYCGKKTALVISSRGCPFQCTYCVWPNTLSSHRYRMRSPKSVVDEIDMLIKEEGIDEVFFDDDEFTINKEKVRGICNEMIERGIKIKWHCMGRVDVVDEEILRLMKRAGCYQIFYGFESGSDTMLKHMKKGITREQMKSAVRLTRKAGMVVGGSFVFGLPQESMETVKETLSFSKSLGADWVQFTLAAPFPGTPFYEEAREKGLLQLDSWSDLDGTHGAIVKTEHLSREDLGGIIRKAYISYYTSPRIVWQNVKRMRNLEDARRIGRGVRSILSRIFYYNK
jgi:radical SAM superfamily enzyme YgiQ (UPF0313 family)